MKYDGFRAVAVIERGHCALISRNGHTFTRFEPLARKLASTFGRKTLVLDGQVVCLDEAGRSQFAPLLFRRGAPVVAAFDLLALGRGDLRGVPLHERKQRLHDVLDGVGGPLLRVQHVPGDQGPALCAQICALDLEGIVGKRLGDTYRCDAVPASWVKVKNPTYSQAEGRRDWFERMAPT